MEQNISTYLKKPELHKDKYIRFGDSCTFNLKLTPAYIAQDRKWFRITYLDDKYILDGFNILIKKNKIKKIFLKGLHPNCNPESHEYCVDEKFINNEWNEENLSILTRSIQTYHLDNCYFRPEPYEYKYKEIPIFSIRR
jgi:hypothetical protein